MGGMRPGRGHHWIYHIKGGHDDGRNFTFYQSKRRNRPSPRGSGMPSGSRLHWGIKGKEKWIKMRNGLWKVVQWGNKYQKGFSTRRKGRLIR